MAYQTIQLLVNVNEDTKANAVVEYAIEFARREAAHLSALIVAQVVVFPIASILPMAEAIVAMINDERLAGAEAVRQHAEVSARVAGVRADCSVAHVEPGEARKTVVAASRVSDLVIAPKSKGVLSTEQKLIEEVLFASGRPVLIVPPEWEAGPLLDHVVVAWDGGARAARAVSDAIPLLKRAGRVEIVTVTADPAEDARGVELATRLTRHGVNVSVTILPLVAADAGRTLLEHLASMRPSLLVMGAFAHARLLEYVVGGTTRLMLTDAAIPVFYSY